MRKEVFAEYNLNKQTGVTAYRHFYEIECYRNGWNKNELGRQYGSSLYERLALSRDKNEVMRLASKGQVIEEPEDIFSRKSDVMGLFIRMQL